MGPHQAWRFKMLNKVAVNEFIMLSKIFYNGTTVWGNNGGTFLMMTSSNGNIFRVTGPLWGNHRSQVDSPHKGQWCAGFRCFLWSSPEQTVEQSRRQWFETPSRSLLHHCNVDPNGDLSPSEHWFGPIKICQHIVIVVSGRHIVSYNLVSIGSGNGLLPDGTKPFYLKQYWLTIYMILWSSFHDNVYLNTQYTNISFMKFTRLKFVEGSHCISGAQRTKLESGFVACLQMPWFLTSPEHQ